MKEDAISSQAKDIKTTITNETKVGSGSNRNSVVDEGRVFNSVAIITRGAEFHHRGDEGKVFVEGGFCLFSNFRSRSVIDSRGGRIASAIVLSRRCKESGVDLGVVGFSQLRRLSSSPLFLHSLHFIASIESIHLELFACKPSDTQEEH